ncbi:MAG: hypothetical protein ACYTEQ_24615, partial [Planctomycetota bacterium]
MGSFDQVEVVRTIGTDGAETYDYSSLNAWEAGEQFQEGTVSIVGEIRGTWASPDTLTVNISGWVTYAGAPIKIRAVGAAKHSGTWSTTAYRTQTNTTGTAFTVDEAFVEVDGLQLYNIFPTNSGLIGSGGGTATGTIKFSNMLLKGRRAWYPTHAATYELRNCISLQHETVGYGFKPHHNGIVVDFYNCIASGAGEVSGFENSTGSVTMRLHNCYAAQPANGYSGTMTLHKCASADTTGSTGLQNIAYSTANFTNVTLGSEDLSLTVGSALRCVGEPNDSRQTDITGTAWGERSLDIGAFSYGVLENVSSIGPGGGYDYTGLVAWEAAEQAVLTDTAEVAEIQAGPLTDDGQCFLSGWTTTARGYIEIRTASSVRHAGVWDAAKPILERDVDTGGASSKISMGEKNVRIVGLQLLGTGSTSSTCWCVEAGASGGGITIVDKCIAKGNVSGSVTSGRGFSLFGASGSTFYVRNCLAYDWINGSSSLYGFLMGATEGRLFHTTAQNCRYNHRALSGTSYALGCISQDPGYRDFEGTWTESDYNCGGTVAPGSNSIVSNAVVFEDRAGDDFRLAHTDTVVQGNGLIDHRCAFDIAGNEREWPDMGMDHAALVETVSTIGVDGAESYDYSSATGWEAGEQRDLVAVREREKGECRGLWATGDQFTTFTIDGWTTGREERIVFEAVGEARHAGVYDASAQHYRQDYSWSATQIIPNEDFTEFIGIAWQRPGLTTSRVGISVSVARTQVHQIKFDSCIFDGHYTTGLMQGTRQTLWFVNCIAHSTYGSIFFQNHGASSTGIFQNVTIGAPTVKDRGFYASGGGYQSLENCYACAPDVAAYQNASSTQNMVNCASNDTTGNTGLQNIAFSTANFANVTAGSFDLHLVSGSALIDVGRTLSGFTEDIDGQTRVDPWDIGADHYFPPPVIHTGELLVVADSTMTAQGVATFLGELNIVADSAMALSGDIVFLTGLSINAASTFAAAADRVTFESLYAPIQVSVSRSRPARTFTPSPKVTESSLVLPKTSSSLKLVES